MSWIKDSNGQSGVAIAGAAKPVENISVANEGVLVAIPLKNTIFDQGNFFAEDGKVHINEDGVYIVTGEVYYPQGNTVGSRWGSIRKNGSERVTHATVAPNAQTNAVVVSISIILKLEKGDYLELTTSQISNATLVVMPEYTQLSIARLGS